MTKVTYTIIALHYQRMNKYFLEGIGGWEGDTLYQVYRYVWPLWIGKFFKKSVNVFEI